VRGFPLGELRCDREVLPAELHLLLFRDENQLRLPGDRVGRTRGHREESGGAGESCREPLHGAVKREARSRRSIRNGARQNSLVHVENGRTDLLEAGARVPDADRSERRLVDVEGNRARAWNEPVEHGRPGLREVALRAYPRVGELRELVGDRESLFDDRTGQDRHAAQHAAVVVNWRDLTRLPADDHDLPVLPEEDGVPNVMGRVEAHAFEIPIRLRSQTSRQARGGGSLGTHGVFAKDLADDFGEVHGRDFSPLRVPFPVSRGPCSGPVLRSPAEQ
jgi:hypothetical protein